MLPNSAESQQQSLDSARERERERERESGRGGGGGGGLELIRLDRTNPIHYNAAH